jgi:hypothetical protein
VRFPRSLIFTVLMYIALYLSIASMPGAFVFDPADSVESARMSRSQEAARIITALSAAGCPQMLLAPDIAVRRTFVPAPSIRQLLLRTDSGPRIAPPEPSPPSEDPA